MSETTPDFTKLGFAKTYLLPGLLIFTIPVVSYLFFKHAQNSFDADARTSLLEQIDSDPEMNPAQRAEARKFFSEVPFSTLLRDPEFAADVDPSLRRNYAMFRWGIELSFWSIVAGVAVFVLMGVCVALSLRSQRAQYYSLLAGWHVLRAYGAVQTVVQGVLLVGLSFWVTALWFNVYVPKLIFIIGLLALLAVAAVVKAIFRRPALQHAVVGTVIENKDRLPLWNELTAVCEKVGSAQPDQVIVGIDDQLFVTEMPITVGDKTYEGRTLYVSLSLLKELNAEEADAVLAHEMAHFSGNDTLYSRKITPLLVRFDSYLEALYSGVVTVPIFYFMNCFRSLFELSLKHRSREREFRADRIAAQVTSPVAFAAGLMRIVAYAKFRDQVQRKLFDQEQVLPSANISQLINDGFRGYAAEFISGADMGELQMSHPFDSHPPVIQRLEAIGVTADATQLGALTAAPGDGRWFQRIDGAAEIEQRHWTEFEQHFRDLHESSLAYRFWPANDDERAVVEKSFPEITIEGKQGPLVLNYATLHYAAWKYPIAYSEIKSCAVDDKHTLTIHYERGGKYHENLKKKDFKHGIAEVQEAFERYYGRYLNAVAYQEQKAAAATGEAG